MTSSTARLPVTLWINFESRHETLRHDQIAFACPKNGSSHIHFKLGVDGLEIPRHAPLQNVISGEELAKVKALIFPISSNESLPLEAARPELGMTLIDVDNLDGNNLQLHIAGLSTGL